MAKLIAIVLASGIALVCLSMAKKTLFGKRLPSFYEAVLDEPWDEMPDGLKELMLGQTRFIGVIFTAVSLSLLGYIAAILIGSGTARVLTLSFASILALGLGLVNYSLHKKTRLDTPWKLSFTALAVLLASGILSGLVF